MRPGHIERSGRHEVVLPSLLIGGLALGLPFLAAAIAPASIAGPLALAAAVGPLVLGFVWRPKAALLAFAITMLFGDTIADALPSAYRSIDEISAPCFVLIGLVRWRPLTRERISVVREGAVALFFAAAIISSLLHAVPLGISGVELVLVAKAIAFFYVVSWIEHRPEDLRAYGQVLVGVSALVLAFAILELVDPAAIIALGMVPPFLQRYGLPSLKGPFIHPVHFAWFCSFVATLAFARFAVMRGWAALAIGLLGSLGVILSARRWSLLTLLAAIAGGLLLYQLSRRSWRLTLRSWAAPLAGTALLLLLFLPSVVNLAGLAVSEYVKPASQAVSASGDSDESLLPRLELYRVSLRIARDDFPFGVGLGRFASWMSGVDYSPVYAEYGLDHDIGLTPAVHPYVTDTFWPQIIGESGVTGLVAYATFLGSIGLSLLRLCRRALARTTSPPELAAFGLGAAAIYVLAMVDSIANTMFHHPPEAFLTFGVFGVGISLLWHRDQPAALPAASAAAAIAANATASAPPRGA